MVHFILLTFCVLSILYWLNPACMKIEKNTDKKRFLFAFTILGLLSALKASTIGNDTPEYVRIYEICPGMDLYFSRYEPGYIFFNQLLNRFSDSPQLLFLATSVIVFYSFGRFIWKYSNMPWLSIVLFFLCGQFAFVMSALRQSFAMAILFFAFEFLLKKKYIVFSALVLLASTFHNSALLFFICLPLSFIKLNKKTIIIFIAVSIISLFLFTDLLNTFFFYYAAYERYTDSDYFQGGVRFASVMQLLLSILFFKLGYDYVKDSINHTNEEKYRANRVMVVIHLVAVYLYILCLRVNLIDRFAIYYSVFMVVFVPNALNVKQLNLKKKIINAFICYYVVFTLTALMYRPNWNTIYPYKFYWQESVRVDEIESRH